MTHGERTDIVASEPCDVVHAILFSWSLCGSKVHELVQRTFSKEVTCSGSGRLCTLESVGRHSFSSLLETSARLGTGLSQGLSFILLLFVCVYVCAYAPVCMYFTYIHMHIHVKYTRTCAHVSVCVETGG